MTDNLFWEKKTSLPKPEISACIGVQLNIYTSSENYIRLFPTKWCRNHCVRRYMVPLGRKTRARQPNPPSRTLGVTQPVLCSWT